MKRTALLTILGMWGASLLPLRAESVLFEQNFEGTAPGPLPKEFLALAGDFAVVTEEGNRVLRLPGSPLDTFGALFGPSHAEPGVVEGRFHGTKSGRKFPTFALSLRGAGGYRLQVSPGKGQLEIYKGDEPLVGVPFSWESGSWTRLRLSLKKGGAGWIAEGWAWKDGGTPSAEAQVRWEISTQPTAGRAAVWGSPFSGTPISFDDLSWKAH
jgi:hypothetical protein